MSVLSDIRESKLFRLAADISVGHWFIGILTGLVPSGGAMLDHRPFWIVFLVFIVACAAGLVAIQVLERLLNSLKKAEFTVFAIVFVSCAVIWVATHPTSKPTKTDAKSTEIARTTTSVNPKPLTEEPKPYNPVTPPVTKKPAKPTLPKGHEKIQPTPPQPSPPSKPSLSQDCPNGICVGGDLNGSATVINGNPEPKISYVLDNEASIPISSTNPRQCVKISVDRLADSPKFAVFCDRACKPIWGSAIQAGIRGNDRWGTIPGHPDVAAFVVGQPNPLPSDVNYMACVESQDNQPIQILRVVKLTLTGNSN